jgi:hypothetical protein
LHINFQFVPLSEHTAPVVKTSHLMLYSEKIVLCYKIYKHINALFMQNIDFFSVKSSGTQSNQWGFKTTALSGWHLQWKIICNLECTCTCMSYVIYLPAVVVAIMSNF